MSVILKVGHHRKSMDTMDGNMMFPEHGEIRNVWKKRESKISRKILVRIVSLSIIDFIYIMIKVGVCGWLQKMDVKGHLS